MKPSEKSSRISGMLDAISQSAFGRTRSEAIESDTCVLCGRPSDPASYRDERSRREFQISGMCQVCQDEVFGGM